MNFPGLPGPLTQGYGKPSKTEGTGSGCHLKIFYVAILKKKKYLHDMDLTLTEHVRNTISLLYKQKTGWNSDFCKFFSEKKSILAILAYILLKINIFRSAMFLLRHWDVICWPIFMILVSIERQNPTLYYMVPNNYTFGVSISKSQGVVTTPLGRRVTKKRGGGSGRQGLIYTVSMILGFACPLPKKIYI